MDLHDGSISVVSKGRGLGSTFTVDLPVYALIANDNINELDLVECRIPSTTDVCDWSVKARQDSIPSMSYNSGIEASKDIHNEKSDLLQALEKSASQSSSR